MINTPINYLLRDPKHLLEKPYEIGWDAKGKIPQTNMVAEPKMVSVHDFRPLNERNSLEQYGFRLEHLGFVMDSEDYDDREKVKEKFYPAVMKLLWRDYPKAARIDIYQHTTRKRDPNASKDVVGRNQPATQVHIDYSPTSLLQLAEEVCGEEAKSYSRIIALNYWKLYSSSGNDWPLAFCDRQTFNHTEDAMPADVVYPNRFTENMRLYHQPDHQWYYFKDLSQDEVLVFIQGDSACQGGGGTPHVSFDHPCTGEVPEPRRSVELRAFVFYA